MFLGFYILGLAALSTACKPGKYLNPECSQWSEWTGDCKTDLCGHCSVQTRNRSALNENCTHPLTDTRQCYNLACVPAVPQVANCKAGCMKECQLEFLTNGQARCKLIGTTVNPTRDFYNLSDSIQHEGKSCYPDMLSCGDWSEWTGDCETQFCGQCKVQTRNRDNINDCRKLAETRQCLNLACRESTQPACFSGTGCLPSCEWIQLDGNYADGRFNGQARCKVPGSLFNETIDDYQCWEGKSDTVHMTTCHPSLPKPDCGQWTEWGGFCRGDLCGHCSVQTRTRTANTNKCTKSTDTRQCYPLACITSVPQGAMCKAGCAPSCDMEYLDNKQARCKVKGTTIDPSKDDYIIFTNTSDSIQLPGKTCHPSMRICGDWSEWTGDCETKYCGQCNVQTRNRTNVNDCKTLGETRQCLNLGCRDTTQSQCFESGCSIYCEWEQLDANYLDGRFAGQGRCKTPVLKATRQCLSLACREPTQPTCFSGTGCMPSCEWLQLNETYAGGRFKGQARCKLPGTTITEGLDDYQVWMGTTHTVDMMTCHPQLPKPDCSPWTEWSGLCREDLCGHCFFQTRNRTAKKNSKCNKPLSDTRQCFGLACVPTVPQVSECTPGCMPACELQRLDNGQARCKLSGTTIDPTKDDYMIFANKPDSIQLPGKTCHPRMRACSPWTEWTGDCQYGYCGQCNAQTRTRTNVNACTLTLSQTRQCLNLACRPNTQPTCYKGNGCAPSCEWMQLDSIYGGGRFNGQARCKLPGTTISDQLDDYQMWTNQTLTVHTSQCHPKLTAG